MSLFTVGIVCYQQYQYLFDCIDSILSQDYSEVELIVSDDASVDFDAEAVRVHIENKRRENLKRWVVYHQNENLGTVQNNNFVAREARGAFLKLIAADDWLLTTNALTLAANELAHYDILCARAQAYTPDGNRLNAGYPDGYSIDQIAEKPPDMQYRLLTNRPWSIIFAPAVFWRRKFLEDMGLFDERYRFTEDWPMWLRVTQGKKSIYILDSVLIAYRQGGISNPSQQRGNGLRKQHYVECIDMLRTEAYPALKKNKWFITAFRCSLSADYLRYRIIRECDWPELTKCQQISKRFRYLPAILFCGYLNKKRNRNKT